MKHFVFFIFFIVSIQSNFSQENLDEGLFFYSHEVNQDKRTSLKLTPEKAIETDGKISMEFYANFRRGDGYYGNIFKIIGNENINIDFVGNLNSSGDNFWLAVNNEILFSYKWENIPKGDYYKWINFKIELDFKNSEITFSTNSYKIKKKSAIVGSIKSLEIDFGKSQHEKFITTDVCPMSIKNIRIYNKKKSLIRFWPLGKHTQKNKVYDEVNSNLALVENPEWLIDQHAFWKKNKDLSFNKLLGTAIDKVGERVFFIEPNKLFIYNLTTNNIDTLLYNNYELKCQSNNFIYNNLKNELISYSIDEKTYKTFDFLNLKWTKGDTNCSETAYFHHNKLINPKDSTLLTFGGYGYYKYKSEINVFDTDSSKLKTINLSSKIAPRYLSSSGVINSDSFLVFGGYGSSSGKQGVGSQIYKDLYSVNFKDFSTKKYWEAKNDINQPYVPVSSMVVDSNSDSFYTLIYNNSNFNTHLKLARFNISEYNLTVYPDSIPYKFLDIKSNVEFFLNQNKTKLNVITVFDNETSLYSLSYPPLLSEDIYQNTSYISSKISWIKYLVLSIIIISFIFFVVFKTIKNRKLGTSKEVIDTESDDVILLDNKVQIKKSSIYLFGGFQVYDKNGEDITAQFTPTLKQLFLIILLSSSKNKKGISSSKLTDLLWPNKSENNARNNRNVNISKLRLLMNKIGDDIDLNNENTYWKIKLGKDIFCDYLFVQNTLIENSKNELSKEQIIDLLNLISNGEISPDVNNEWIDDYKEEIVNMLVDDLMKISSYLNDPSLLVKLSSIILKYAPLSEEAINIKCKSLYKLGRKGSAKKNYNEFCNFYYKILDSKYDQSFKEIISG